MLLHLKTKSTGKIQPMILPLIDINAVTSGPVLLWNKEK